MVKEMIELVELVQRAFERIIELEEQVKKITDAVNELGGKDD